MHSSDQCVAKWLITNVPFPLHPTGPALSSSGSDSDEDTNPPPKRARGQGKDKGQRSLVQAPQPSGSESEFDSLANEIILREQEEGVGSDEGLTKRRGGRGRTRGRRK